MDRIINQLHFIREGLNIIQRRLDFEDWDYELYPQFATQKSLGRTALLSLGLGIALGIHFTLLIILTLFFDFDDDDDDVMLLLLLWQWCFYVCTMCIFHLLEFFTTAIYNPLECTGDSFLVNQSKAYTAAALISATEFWLKFTFRCWLLVSKSSSTSSPGNNNNLVDVWLIRIGVIGVFVSQYIRFISMKTCGESFNHKIQTSKKENHTLIKTGIYTYLRHPSYVGFYYWSISTQLVLTNYLSTLLFAIASWMFFKRRIPYEEESLVEHFPNEYPLYAQSTYVGIPFIPNLIDVYVEEMKQRDNNNQEEDDGEGEGVEVTDTTTNNENDHHNNHKKEN